MKTVVLNLDEYLSWRSSEEDLCLRLTSGDTAALTISENGHDARAIHLSMDSEIEILAGHWFTIETLGIQSKIIFNKNNFKETIAPPEWRPTPRSSALK
ncbi:MAG: hypothetical protein CMM76_13135 [Rhodospirillaceae bacterium]|nr:hypothetical protein [Rhodospirillaceae bacterium]|tara:strand:+ start:237 stop:533 length:297 start_codon:yes stop_codon:yes gene_type:complete